MLPECCIYIYIYMNIALSTDISTGKMVRINKTDTLRNMIIQCDFHIVAELGDFVKWPIDIPGREQAVWYQYQIYQSA